MAMKTFTVAVATVVALASASNPSSHQEGFTIGLQKTHTPKTKSPAHLRGRTISGDTKYRYKDNTWSGYLSRLLVGSNKEEELNVANNYDVTFTTQIKAGGDTPLAMQSVFDTSSSDIVLETDACSDCSSTLNVDGADNVSSGTAVSGTLKNPTRTSYSGESGTVKYLCVYDADQDATYTGTPDPTTMPCIGGAGSEVSVNFANDVSDANTDVTAFVGVNLASESLMTMFEDNGNFVKRLGFSFFLDDFDSGTADESYIDFGKLDYSNKKTGTTEKEIQMDTSSSLWQTDLNGISIGNFANQEYGLNDQTLVIESALQCLYVPTDWYDFVKDNVMNWSTGYYVNSDGEIIVDCYSLDLMQKVGLLVNDHWVELLVTDYTNYIWTEYNGAERQTGACSVCINESWDAKWHAGSALL